MQNAEIINVLTDLTIRHPLLKSCTTEIEQAFDILYECYKNKNKLLVCGNGGSAADSEHIVGELMKSFMQPRILPEAIQNNLKRVSPDNGSYMATKLQPALTAISLSCHTSLNTAFANDVDPNLIFAQQVIGYGVDGDVLLGISTSGNAENILNALITAKSLGLKTIGLTGKSGGRIKEYCDVIIGVEGSGTAEIQELHQPVYHALCNMLELKFFGSETENI
jgi:D-sedoheptulose 7-phosphate isomerase